MVKCRSTSSRAVQCTATLKWDFLTEDQGGDTPFLYALRGDTARQWVCTEHERVRGSPNSFSATSVQNFTPTLRTHQ